MNIIKIAQRSGKSELESFCHFEYVFLPNPLLNSALFFLFLFVFLVFTVFRMYYVNSVWKKKEIEIENKIGQMGFQISINTIYGRIYWLPNIKKSSLYSKQYKVKPVTSNTNSK